MLCNPVSLTEILTEFRLTSGCSRPALSRSFVTHLAKEVARKWIIRRSHRRAADPRAVRQLDCLITHEVVMPNKKPSITYKDTCDIARHHGWIVAGLY